MAELAQAKSDTVSTKEQLLAVQNELADVRNANKTADVKTAEAMQVLGVKEKKIQEYDHEAAYWGSELLSLQEDLGVQMDATYLTRI